MDTISLSRTVFEIFDIKICRVWPWPLTSESHLESKHFILFECPCMTSYLTFMDTISLSHTVREIMPIKILMVKQIGGFWPFKGQGRASIFSIKNCTFSQETASFEILYIKIGSPVQAVRVPKGVKSYKKKKKKHQTLYVGYMYISPCEIFRNQIFLDYQGRWPYQSCQIFFNRFTRVSLARGRTSLFSVHTVDGYYNCCTAVQMWCTCKGNQTCLLKMVCFSFCCLRITVVRCFLLSSFIERLRIYVSTESMRAM